MGYEYEPPEWQPNAVPTELGWRHPITNELLVSVPGGVKSRDIPVLTDVVLPEPVVLEVTQTEPVKRKRGRPRKNAG